MSKSAILNSNARILIQRKPLFLALFFSALIGSPTAVFAKPAPTLSTLGMPVPPAISRSTPTGAPSPSQVMHIAVSLAPRDPQGMQLYADSVSTPGSSFYGHYLTPAKFGQMFGAASSDVSNVVSFLTKAGLTIKLIADSHLAILADGTVSQVESAFHTKIGSFHLNAPEVAGRTDFYAYETPIKAPSNIAPLVVAVSGLENYTKPVPRHRIASPKPTPGVVALLQGGVQTLTPTQTRTLYDLAPIYNAGMTGQGRNIAISSFDGFRLSNIPLWYAQYNLPTPAGGVGSNVTVDAIDGGSGGGTPGGEGDLDMQMVLGMAPTCTLTIYDGGLNLIDVLTKEAQDNTADIITESYGWELSVADATACHNAHVQMTTQGITYMEATGDDGTTLEPDAYSNYEPEVFQVGGTTATVASDGTRMTEVGWSGSGGGWATDNVPFNTLPSWQKGTNVPTNINFRLNPDVALHAAGDDGAYLFFLNGQLTPGYDGTSFASPVFAGSLGTSEQKMISLGDITVSGGKYRLGRISDVVYKQNGRADVWFDIISGNNGILPNGQQSNAGPFWDFVCGFGAIDFNAFVKTYTVVAHPVTVTATSVGIYDGQGAAASGGPADLIGTPGSYYTEASVPSPQGLLDAAVMSFTLTTNASKLTSLTLSLVENGPTGTSNFVYLYNYAKKSYDLVNTSANNALDTSLKIPINNIANYVGPNLQMQVVDRMIWPNRVGQPYSMKLNLAQMLETM